MKIEDKKYLLVENRDSVREIDAAAMAGEFNEGDRVLVLPADLSAIDRIRALAISKRWFLRGKRELRKMGAELHLASSAEMQMADLAVRCSKRGVTFGAIMALGLPLALLPYLHYAVPSGAKGRAILDADQTYLNYVYQNKAKGSKTPVIDKAKTKADLDDFRAWQAKEKAHD